MLDNKINSSSVETQENQPEGSLDLNKMIQNSSNLDIANDHKKLKERITDLLKGDTEFSEMKQGDKAFVVGAASGLFTAVLPLLAVGATLAIPGAIVGLALYFAVKVAVKAVQSGYKGLKWSAEKTVDGAKYTAGKVKDASTYAAGKIRDGAVHAKDKIKSSTSNVVHNVSQSLDRLSSQTNYSDAMLNSQLLSDDAKGKIVSIKEQLMGIFNNEEIANKDKLLKKILKDIVLQIESKKDHAQGTDSEKYAPEWDKQINFIKDLNAEKLHDLLTKQSLPKDTYFLYTIFFEHHDKVERIVKQCKAEHRLSDGVEKLNEVAKRYGKSRRGSMQSIENSLSKSSSLNSVRTDSTISSEAKLLDPANRKEIKQSSGFFSRFKRNETPKEATNVEYQTLSESDMQHRKIGKSTFYVDTPTESTAKTATVNPNLLRRSSSSSSLTPKLTPVASPELPRSVSLLNLNELNASPQNSFSEDVLNDPIVKQNLDSFSNGTPTRSDSVDSLASNCSFKSAVSNHNGFDSGFNSPTSSPTHTVFTNEDGKAKAQADLKKTGHLNKLVGQPSTYTSKAYIELQQPAATQGATASK